MAGVHGVHLKLCRHFFCSLILLADSVWAVVSTTNHGLQISASNKFFGRNKYDVKKNKCPVHPGCLICGAMINDMMTLLEMLHPPPPSRPLLMFLSKVKVKSQDRSNSVYVNTSG